MKKVVLCAIASSFLVLATAANARSAYDGSWNLVFVTRSGAVRASVTVQDKYASGAGRLSSTTGHGRWSGRSGKALCAGYWTAQRN